MLFLHDEGNSVVTNGIKMFKCVHNSGNERKMIREFVSLTRTEKGSYSFRNTQRKLHFCSPCMIGSQLFQVKAGIVDNFKL